MLTASLVSVAFAADPRPQAELLLQAAETKLQRQSLDALLARLETQQHTSRADLATAPSREEKAGGSPEAKPAPRAEVSPPALISRDTKPGPKAPQSAAPAPTPPHPAFEPKSPAGPSGQSDRKVTSPNTEAPPRVAAESKESLIAKPEPPPSAAVQPEPKVVEQRPAQKSAALEQGIERIEFIDYGIYKAERNIRGRDAVGINQATGFNFRHATTARVIPAQIGISFGFGFRILGQPYNAPVDLRAVIKFPPPGLVPSPAATPITQDQFAIHTRIGQTEYFAYTIEDRFELVPGTWTMEVWLGDRNLGTQTFRLTN